MVELATLELTAKTDGLTKAETALQGLRKEVAATEAAAGKLTTGAEAVSKSMGGASGNAKLLMQQLSQVAQQGAATGQWGQAFAIQLADIGAAFGVVGLAVGALATVGLPLLTSAFSNLYPQTLSAKDALDQLSQVQTSLKATQDILGMSAVELTQKFGVYASSVREAAQALAELQIAQGQADLAASLKSANSELDYLLTNTRAGFQNIRDEFGTTSEQTQILAADFQAIRNAATIQDKLAAFAALSDHMKTIGVDASTLPESLRQAMANGNQLTITMAQLETQMNNTASAAARVASGSAGGTVTSLLPQLVAAGGRSTGGTTGTTTGGGARTDTLQTQLEALQRSLMSKEEIENASYARSQATLTAALAARKITQDEYNSLTEQEWQAHNDRLAQIDVYRYGTTLEKTGAFFGTMQTLLSSGGEGMVRAARIAGAAQALINAWVAYTEQLKAPVPLTPWGRLAAAASILSAGLGAVNAIKSGSTSASKASGSSVGSTSSTASTSTQKTITVQIEGDTAYAALLRQNISVIAEALQAESGIGGFVVA